MSNDLIAPEEMSPEGMRVIEAYLEAENDLQRAADILGEPLHIVTAIFNRAEVKNYINTLFMESGFRNRDKFFGIMDTILEKKMQDLEESDLGSDADILEIMKTYHKMKMDEMAMNIKVLEAQSKVKTPLNQTNIQNNFNIPGSEDNNYMTLMKKLASGGK